jgi:endoglucanase
VSSRPSLVTAALAALLLPAACAGGGAAASPAAPAVEPTPPPGPSLPWGLARGMTTGVDLTEADVAAFAATSGNLLRVGFPGRPLAAVDPPHAFDEGAFAYLERVLDWCEPRGVRVLVDPHRFPGTRHPWTMLGDDPFFADFRWHDEAARIWSEIAKRLARRGEVVAGYDLLNEPEVRIPMATGSPGDLNLLYERLIAAIRRYDRRHTIVLAAPRFVGADGSMRPYHEGLAHLRVPDDPNVVFETHTYDPMEFTHQGVSDPSDPFVPYPGTIGGVRWDRARVQAYHEPVAEFVRRTGRHVLVGEFSCPRWTSAAGNAWLRDVIETAEENGWSWTYHAWREASVWDAERSNTDRADETRHSSTSRMELLEGFFARNPR